MATHHRCTRIQAKGNTRAEPLERRYLLSAFVVTNSADAGEGSLRDAITAANANPGADTIAFNIPGDGVHFIRTLSALPTITDTVTIDGYTQPGSRPNSLAIGDNAVLQIQLKSALTLGDSAYGHNVSGSVLRGLVVPGLTLRDGSDFIVEGNFIGTDPTGSTANPSSSVTGFAQALIFLDWAYKARIGGPDPASRNLIAGGIAQIGMGSGSGLIQNNYIGTDASGARAICSGGIDFRDNTSSVIVANVITGGIKLRWWVDEAGRGTVVQDNFIGTDVTGTVDFGHLGDGVYIEHCSGIRVTGNTIAFHAGRGVWLADTPWYQASARILNNRIYSNGGLAIQLGQSIAPNDPMDLPHALVDDMQRSLSVNFPVLLSAVSDNSGTTIRGVLNTTPSQTTTIELFASDAPGFLGTGQGQRPIAQTTVTTDANGNASFAVTVAEDLTGQFVSATSTIYQTSPFSAPLAVGTARQGPIFSSFGQIAPYSDADGLMFSWRGKLTVMGTFGDLGTGARTVTIDWGDGSALQDLTVNAADGVFTQEHQYSIGRPVGIIATISDGDGNSSTAVAASRWGRSNIQLSTDPLIAPNQPVSVACSFTPRAADFSYQIRWEFGDGTVLDWQDTTTPGALTPNHVFTHSGTYPVQVWIREEGGGLVLASRTLPVQTWAFAPDPLAPAQQALFIWGTPANDDIHLTAFDVYDPRTNRDVQHLRVTYNGVTSDIITLPSRLLIYGADGSDTITIDPALKVPASISGGSGDDTIFAGSGDDTLLGEAGADQLHGGDGNDLLAGGPGNDTLWGEAGDDQLHGGQGDDILYGNKGRDTLWGDKGSNYLDAGQGNDILFARNAQLDSIIGGAGTDSAQIDPLLDPTPFNDLESLLT